MKRQPILLCVTLALLTNSVSTGTYSGGTGEPNNPYRIATAEDLNDISNHPEDFNKCFIMTADINLSGTTYDSALLAPDTNNNNFAMFDGTPFNGIFDGNEHKIAHLVIDTIGGGYPYPYAGYLGLFGNIGPAGEVRNLGVEDVNIALKEDSIRVGGLIGWNEGSIAGCYTTGRISGGFHTGSQGGLVGRNENGNITGCYSTVRVTGDGYIGGLSGLNFASISNCYATGVVSGTWNIGGLVGYNGYTGSITNCYATGSATGGNIGGLVGYNDGGSISNCVWDTDTSGMANGVGLGDSFGVVGKTTDEMQDIDTFLDIGWDLVEFWNIGENQTYLYLRVYPAGDLNHDFRVDFFDFAIFAQHWLESTTP